MMQVCTPPTMPVPPPSDVDVSPGLKIESRNAGAKVEYYLVPFQQGTTAELRPRAIALMLAAGFILLIACANLAGLTLVRMARRSTEVATRLALGASSWQIKRQLWIENLLLACIGGAAGVGGTAERRRPRRLIQSYFVHAPRNAPENFVVISWSFIIIFSQPV